MKTLQNMVRDCESMDEMEKNYWASIIDTLKEDTKDSLYAILQEESDKLSDLEMKYQEEQRKLNIKHLAEWEEFRKEKTNLTKHANRNDIGIRPECDRTIYLAAPSKSESMHDDFRVKIDMVRGGGVVNIPVRIIEPIGNNISALEQVVKF